MEPLKAQLRESFVFLLFKACAAQGGQLARRWRRVAWYRSMRRFYAQFIRPGDLAFDVGANLGSRTRVFLELGAQVVAVEPQEECARRLHGSFHSNPNFHLVGKALGAAEGAGELFLVNHYSTLASMSRAWIQAAQSQHRLKNTWETARQVSVTTLDALIQEYGRPQFVKIDVEGFEYEIMRGLSHPLIDLSLEFHPIHLEPALQSIRHLSRLGPVALNYAIGERFEWMLDRWVTPGEMIAVLETCRAVSWLDCGDVYVRFIG